METKLIKVEPVKGAARYVAFGKEIWMIEPGGHESCIDTRKSEEVAKKEAIRWQKKENRAVLKAAGQI